MGERSTDLRVTKTIRGIHAAFEAMVCEMPYHKITVTALCERALINKKTFYRYYGSMDALLDEFREELMAEFYASIQSLSLPRDTKELVCALYAFADEHGEIFDRIIANEGPFQLIAAWAIEGGFSQWGSTGGNDEDQRMLFAFIMGATMNVYRQWVLEGKAISKGKMIEITARMLSDGIPS